MRSDQPYPCPNYGCRHSVLMHEMQAQQDGTPPRLVCIAIDRVPDDRLQRYVEARCPCGQSGEA